MPIDEVTRMRADPRTALDAIGSERLPDDPAVPTVHAADCRIALRRERRDAVINPLVMEVRSGGDVTGPKHEGSSG
ncbi:MAG TPA: hypothetical protein VN969_30680 [Streptosporangiaceae bacterium]|nr:hypothetical protein [Streptosporangiaceae bacterium]